MAPSYDSTTRATELIPLYGPHIGGKTILVTGISPGSLGEGFVRHVSVAKPATFILAGRTPAKFQPLIEELAAAHPETIFKSLALDLTSFAKVREAAAAVNSWTDIPRIDLLVNNAGIMAVPYQVTEDGHESQFQTNHLGHFLLTNLIMNKILASGDPRIVNVSSGGHRLGQIRWTDTGFDGGKNYERWGAYGQSKTANCLFSLALADRLGAARGLSALSLCPGFVMTNLAAHAMDDFGGFLNSMHQVDVAVGTKYLWGIKDVQPKDLDRGVATHVFASFDQGLKEKNGEFLTDCHVADPYEEEVYSWARSSVDADRLWKLSEKLIGEEFVY